MGFNLPWTSEVSTRHLLGVVWGMRVVLSVGFLSVGVLSMLVVSDFYLGSVF